MITHYVKKSKPQPKRSKKVDGPETAKIEKDYVHAESIKTKVEKDAEGGLALDLSWDVRELPQYPRLMETIEIGIERGMRMF